MAVYLKIGEMELSHSEMFLAEPEPKLRLSRQHLCCLSERSFDRASKNERKTNLRKRYSLKMDKVAVPFPQLKVNLRVGRRIRELVGSWSERPL
jgi:hypothetical protein